MTKTYLAEELFQEIPGDPENILLNIPPEICKEANLNPGDTVDIRVENGSMIISKV